MTEPSEAGEGHDDASSILVVENLICRFGGLQVLNGVDFTVDRRSVTALIGPNGAGKSTLFNAMTGFTKTEQGNVRYNGKIITGMQPRHIVRLGIARTFQLTRTLASMTVLDNMLVAAQDHRGERLCGLLARGRNARHREQQARERASELLQTFRLASHADKYAGTLSGGQRKLLELARVLMLDPALILLDEPMAGVNPALGQLLLEHVHQLRDQQGTTFLFVEHDMDAVARFADNVIVMANGRIITDGSPAAVSQHPEVIDAYLGTGA